MLTKKLSVLLGVLVFLGATTGQLWANGQKQSSSQPATQPQKTTITVATSLGWRPTDILVPIIAKKLATEGITIKTIASQGTSLRDKQILAANSGGGTYDVYLAWDAILPLMQKYGTPLNSYLEQAGVNVANFEKQFYPTVVQEASVNGKLYWIPIHVEAQTGYARRDLFLNPKNQSAFKAQYGYALPQPDSSGVITFKTQKEFVDVAKFFTRKGSNGQTNLWGYVMAGKWDQGNTVFEDELFRSGLGYFDQQGHSDWGPMHPANQQIVKSIATFDYNTINKWHITSPGVLSMQLTEIGQLFAEGKAAMSFTWNIDNWHLYKDGTAFQKKYGLPLSWVPTFWDRSAKDHGLMSVWAWEMNKNSQHKAAAVKFLLAAASSENYLEGIHNGLSVGNGMRSISEWLVNHHATPGAYIPAVATVGTFWPTSPAFPQTGAARDVLRKYHEELLSGQITPEQFVKKTADGVDALMHKAGYF